MKIERLIGILSILLQKEITTVPELAEHFEVSRRTINRDIETLCQAGIPIQTTQGVGGGISIMDGYRMDRTLNMTKAGYAVHVISDCVTSYDLKKLDEMYSYYVGKGCEVKDLTEE